MATDPGEAFRTNAVIYTLFKVSTIVGPGGQGELSPVGQAERLTDLFQMIPKLGLVDKPHVIVVSMTLVSPFAPKGTTAEPWRPAGLAESG